MSGNEYTIRKTKITEAQRRAQKKYDEKNIKAYTVKMQNSLYSILEKAFSENSTYNNRNAYVIQAIREKLEREGYL